MCLLTLCPDRRSHSSSRQARRPKPSRSQLRPHGVSSADHLRLHRAIRGPYTAVHLSRKLAFSAMWTSPCPPARATTSDVGFRSPARATAKGVGRIPVASQVLPRPAANPVRTLHRFIGSAPPDDQRVRPFQVVLRREMAGNGDHPRPPRPSPPSAAQRARRGVTAQQYAPSDRRLLVTAAPQVGTESRSGAAAQPINHDATERPAGSPTTARQPRRAGRQRPTARAPPAPRPSPVGPTAAPRRPPRRSGTSRRCWRKRGRA